MSTKRVLGKPVKRIDEQWRRERRRASQYYCLSISHSDRTIFLLFMEPLFVSPTESKCTCLKTIHRHHGVLMSILEKRHEDWKDCSAGKHARYYCRALKFSSQHPIWLTHKTPASSAPGNLIFFWLHLHAYVSSHRHRQKYTVKTNKTKSFFPVIKNRLFSNTIHLDFSFYSSQFLLVSSPI